MIPVRQSTAFETAIGPVLDSSGVAVTDCVVGDFKLKKTSGNFAALNGSATLTHVSAGFYDLVLTTSDTDTVGTCCVVIDDTTNACAPLYLQVVEEAVYDELFAASAAGYQVPIWASASSTVSLSNTTVATVTTTTTATNVTTVNGLAAGAITAAAIAADAIGASELAADAVAEIADAVWDEVLSGHLTAGSTGNALNAAGSAGDPWSTSLPGAYGAGSAGYIIGTNLNATVSSRSSHSAADVWAVATRVLTAATNVTSTGAAVPITAGGLVSSDVTAISTDTTAANNCESFFDGTGYAGTNNVIPLVTTTTTLTNKDGFTLSVAGIEDIWQQDIAGFVGAAEAGKLLYDMSGYIDASISGLPTAANISAEVWSDTSRTLTGTQAFNLTGNITGNLSGSVGSVTGAVGSVTGNVGGNVVGSVASVTATVSADMVSVSGDTVAADNLESYLDGTNFMPVDAHKPIFSISGATLTVKKPDGVTSAYTRTLTTDAAAEPVTGSS